jgi:hypothetical protein
LFAETSPQSWAEAGVADLLSGRAEVSLDEAAGDRKGPIPIAAAVSVAAMDQAAPGGDADPVGPDTPRPETRVAVFGDSDFVANTGLGIQGNRDLFMNTLGWLSQQESLIAIRPKSAEDRRITLTATQQSNIIWLSLLVIPAGIFGTGVYAWSRRR